MPARIPHHPLLGRTAGIARKGWPVTLGIGGRIASESVAGLLRNTQSEALIGAIAAGRPVPGAWNVVKT